MTKRYTLKPGRHQFAPGSHAAHTNNNLSDEEAQWYLEKYPHIASMFISIPKPTDVDDAEACRVSAVEIPAETEQIGEIENKSVKSNNNEDLFTTN